VRFQRFQVLRCCRAVSMWKHRTTDDGATVIALVGGVGQGKTTLWRRLGGRQARTFLLEDSGTQIPAVEISDGKRVFQLVDTPGIEGLSGGSRIDLLVWDLLLDPRVGSVGLVAGGRDLRRGILLALQLTELDKPLVFNINSADEARQAGIHVDRKRLEDILGVRVVETVATEGEGVRALGKALTAAGIPKRTLAYHPDIEDGITRLSALIPDKAVPKRAVAIRILESPDILRELEAKGWGSGFAARCESVVSSVQEHFSRALSVVMAGARIRHAEAILDDVVSVSPPRRLPLAERLGRWARHPASGVPMGILVIALLYLFVGKVGAQWLVGCIEGGLFQDRLIPWTEQLLRPIPWRFARDAVVGDFGLVSVGLTLAFGIVMPVLVTFFLAFNLLEDSGYLARLSILLDQGLRKIGLGGKGLFPLVMGFSCITMALLTTRVLGTRKERIIASLLLILGLPCAPLLSVMLVVLAPMPWTAPVFVFGVIFLQIVVIGHIAARVLPGEQSDFIFAVPPMRIPKLSAIVRKTAIRSWWFVVEAVPFFLVATFALFVLEELGGLRLVERTTRPVVHGFLVLPEETVDVFIMTLIRREAGAALLKQLSDGHLFTNLQVVITILVMTFFSPCVNALLVLFKERGFRTGLAIIGFVMPYSVALGGFLHWVLRSLGVTFR